MLPLLLACAAPSDECEAPPNERAAPTADMEDAAASANALGLALLRQRADDNAFLAPASIATALGLTLAGAAGTTRDELRAALGLAGEDAALHEGLTGLNRAIEGASFTGDGCPTWTLAGDAAAFVDGRLTLKEPYLDTLADPYGLTPAEVDYEGAPGAAADAINAWASGATDGHVTEISDAAAYDADTLLVLATAVYFEGKWLDPFDESLTETASFWLESGDATDAQFMTSTATRAWGFVEGATVVELPYRGEDVSMVLVVPDANDGLDAVLSALDPASLDAEGLAAEEVTVVLPRFEVRSGASLVDPLRALGVVDLFDPDAADLFGMADPPEGFDFIYVGDVTHEAWIRVEESGTVAAAATAVEGDGGNDSGPRIPEEVRADRPFLYVIRDRVTGAWLFTGRMDAPPAE